MTIENFDVVIVWQAYQDVLAGTVDYDMVDIGVVAKVVHINKEGQYVNENSEESICWVILGHKHGGKVYLVKESDLVLVEDQNQFPEETENGKHAIWEVLMNVGRER